MEVKKYNPFVFKPNPKTTVPPASEARRLSLRQSLKLRAYLKRIKRN